MNDVSKPEMGKREVKKAELRERLIQAARSRIRENGLSGLRARDITADAGCALGALYTAFEDIDTLVLYVNSITLGELGDELAEITRREKEPSAQLVALAQGYLAFACDNPNLWSALFDHHMPAGVGVPDWHLAEHAVLFDRIMQPLSKLDPGLDQQELVIRSRSIFAAVHGIVSISLQDRFIAVPREELDRQLVGFVEIMVQGLKAIQSQ